MVEGKHRVDCEFLYGDQSMESDIMRCNKRILDNLVDGGGMEKGGQKSFIMIIGTFNIRGGGSYVKRRHILHSIDKGKADIFLIQETKLSSVFHYVVNSFWHKELIYYSVSDSVGLSGGMLILWKRNKFDVLCSFRGLGYLGVKISWKSNLYYIINVYSDCSREDKRLLWNSFLELKSVFNDGEWVIRGDFNAVKNRRDRVGRSECIGTTQCRDFSAFIDDMNLVGVVGQRIDERDVSDHCPVWLVAGMEDRGPKPFKFKNECFGSKEFMTFVEKEWAVLEVSGRGDFVLKEKLRLLKATLRRWNLNVFGKHDLEIEK
ncbi:uncharacterized protein LOC131649721 [Vicia villosa]|uniref:uncharacterized protein LOC131649721 n=1 Tax=Vicia villosa TaxID=3911 RepID=UPI00273C4220|nr:uncharacterized protein LOC131649721 [Vicia villosa]